jgi:hypothetical protein
MKIYKGKLENSIVAVIDLENGLEPMRVIKKSDLVDWIPYHIVTQIQSFKVDGEEWLLGTELIDICCDIAWTDKYQSTIKEKEQASEVISYFAREGLKYA